MVENTLQAFAEYSPEFDFIAFSGEEYSGSEIAQHQAISGLGYESEFHDVGTMLEQMEQTCQKHWGQLPDVWHIHNHSLGKNVNMPGLLNSLIEKGAKILLHTHDFAEEGRPSNFQLNQKGIAAGEACTLCRNQFFMSR